MWPSKKDVIDSVITDVATPKIRNSNFDVVATYDLESDLDSSDGEEPSTEDIQEAYQIMYDNWIKVCKTNKALKERVAKLTKEKDSTNEGNSIDDESLVLLMKNLNIFLNRMNMKNNSQKDKKYVSLIESKKQHIEDSDGSQEDDDDHDHDHVSNIVAFQERCY